MGVIRQVVKECLATCLPPDRLLVRGRQVAANVRPAISLTFDDGPDPIHTPRLLDQLGELGLRGTFFVIGQKVLAHPELVRRIVAGGHELGNHSFFHSEPRYTSTTALLQEVAETNRVIRDACGVDCRLMRPPYGKVSLAKLRGLWRAGQTVVLWNVDPKDYRTSSTQSMQKWCDHYEPRPGDIVLFHDNHPMAAVAVKDLWQRGIFDRFICVAISQWLPARRPVACGTTTCY